MFDPVVAMDELQAGLATLDVAERLSAVSEAIDRLHGTLLDTVNDSADQGVWAAEGGYSNASWIAGWLRLGPGQARRLTGLARRSRRLPGLREQLRRGAIRRSPGRMVEADEAGRWARSRSAWRANRQPMPVVGRPPASR